MLQISAMRRRRGTAVSGERSSQRPAAAFTVDAAVRISLPVSECPIRTYEYYYQFCTSARSLGGWAHGSLSQDSRACSYRLLFQSSLSWRLSSFFLGFQLAYSCYRQDQVCAEFEGNCDWNPSARCHHRRQRRSSARRCSVLKSARSVQGLKIFHSIASYISSFVLIYS